MARGSTTAQTAATSAGDLSGSLENNASGLYGELAPQLEAETANPQGFGPTELAQINTAGMQTGGGTQAGTVGQGGLLAARTRNAGAAQGAIGASARQAGQRLSQNAVNTQVENAQLKERQRQAGLSGLENLTGLETGEGIAASGQIAPDVNANTNAENGSWDWAKYLLDPLLSAGAAGARAGGGGGGGGGPLSLAETVLA